MVQLTINGQTRNLPDIDPETPLLWALRDTFGLVGTKYGCGIAFCGACTVHVDGAPKRACQIAVGTLEGKTIVTIEGLAENGALHPLQQAWIDHDVAQCGYCQAGQIMSAAALLARRPDPSDKDIDQALAGNLCRCGTYQRIRRAVKAAAAAMGETKNG
ncbi:MAG: (2Fe-2S)-binding protein [Amphiplicatus sp.]